MALIIQIHLNLRSSSQEKITYIGGYNVSTITSIYSHDSGSSQ